MRHRTGGKQTPNCNTTSQDDAHNRSTLASETRRTKLQSGVWNHRSPRALRNHLCAACRPSSTRLTISLFVLVLFFSLSNVSIQVRELVISTLSFASGKDSKKAHDPSEYSVLIFQYHKSGTELSEELSRFLVQKGKRVGLKENPTGRGPYPKRQHDKVTKCPKFNLIPGAVYVQQAPDFFCSTEELHHGVFLSQLALQKKDNTRVKKRYNGRPLHGHTATKISSRHRGTKMIHLIRNPYTLALSNYFYHAQNPTPEDWVHRAQPCEYHYPRGITTINSNESIKSLILPTLPSISPDQFDKACLMCWSLFQNQTDISSVAPKGNSSESMLHNSSFYDHLTHLNQYDGLRLATAQMILSAGYMTGSWDRNNKGQIFPDKNSIVPAGADILRMGNNIIKLNQLLEFQHTKREEMSAVSSFLHANATKLGSTNEELIGDFQLLTMEMSQWMSNPYESTMKVVDFIFENSISAQEKHSIAKSYQETYRSKISAGTSNHITTGKSYGSDKKEELVAMMRGDDSLAPILDEVEKLVNDVMS